jgi:hypothetical protein
LQNQQQAPQPGFEQRFKHQLAKTVATAWLISTGEGLRWPGIIIQGARPALSLGLMHHYLDLVLYSATARIAAVTSVSK